MMTSFDAHLVVVDGIQAFIAVSLMSKIVPAMTASAEVETALVSCGCVAARLTSAQVKAAAVPVP